MDAHDRSEPSTTAHAATSRSPSDATLVARHRAGDLDAFATLYRRYQPQVWAQCYARLRDRDLADEATQETFARVLRRAATFEGGARISHYIVKVARFVCLDLIAERSLERPLWGPDLRPDDLDVEHVVERRISAVTVLRGVSDSQANLLVEHHVEDRPLASIAAEIDSTSNSVAVMLHRARAAARGVAQARGIRAVLPLPLLARVPRWLGGSGEGRPGTTSSLTHPAVLLASVAATAALHVSPLPPTTASNPVPDGPWVVGAGGAVTPALDDGLGWTTGSHRQAPPVTTRSGGPVTPRSAAPVTARRTATSTAPADGGGLIGTTHPTDAVTRPLGENAPVVGDGPLGGLPGPTGPSVPDPRPPVTSGGERDRYDVTATVGGREVPLATVDAGPASGDGTDAACTSLDVTPVAGCAATDA